MAGFEVITEGLKTCRSKASGLTLEPSQNGNHGEPQKHGVMLPSLHDRTTSGGIRILRKPDMLNDRMLPLFEEQDAPLLRVLTDRGSARHPGTD